MLARTLRTQPTLTTLHLENVSLSGKNLLLLGLLLIFLIRIYSWSEVFVCSVFDGSFQTFEGMRSFHCSVSENDVILQMG